MQNIDGGFDAVRAAANGTASDRDRAAARDGGRLCSITFDAPGEERSVLSASLSGKPDVAQLAHVARSWPQGASNSTHSAPP